MRGGEKCLEVLCEIFPDAPIYTLFYEKGKVSPVIAAHGVYSSYIQRLPGVYKSYRNYLPLFSSAMDSLDLSEYDLVISTSHCVAKGAKKKSGAVHICYCFTPVRYVWGFFHEYFGSRSRWMQSLIRGVLEGLKDWDLKVNARVDHFVAISHHIRKRIETHYGRAAQVIYPPVDSHFFTPDASVRREDYYLVVSALVPYKKIDLALEAFAQNKKKLIVIGDGPERKRLEEQAPKNIQFLGWQSDAVLRDYYRRARALIFPGEEDFGIVPLEMQACGGPVIAYGVGGALETVVEGQTGLFFYESTAEALTRTIEGFETLTFDEVKIAQHAKKFSRERYKDEMIRMILEQTKNKIPGVASCC